MVPAGAGKGTISRIVAKKLGFHYLDSGALYRLLGIASQRHNLKLSMFPAWRPWLSIWMSALRPLAMATLPSTWKGRMLPASCAPKRSALWPREVAKFPEVRAALLKRQQAFARDPGLVADGRDMGTAVFPDAPVKLFLTASAEERAARRYKELLEKGESVSLPALVEQVRS